MVEWSTFQAPTLDDLERLATEAYAALPDEFRTMCGDLIIQIDDFPEDEILEELDCETPFDLLGLFQGVGMAQGGGERQTGQMPNMIWLYRRPILDYWAEHNETLGHLITHVLVHEIGHHFGLSDHDMAMIELTAGGRPPDFIH